MALTFLAVSGAATVASGDITLSEPAVVQDGDLLVACIAYRSSAPFALPSGWSLVATQQSSGNTSTTLGTSVASGLMAYVVRGTSPPALTFTRSGGDVALGRIAAYRGVDRSNPYDTGSANTPASNVVLTPTGSITTGQDDELLVMACCLADNVSAGAQRAAEDPTQLYWHERADSNTITGADTGLAIADSTKLLAGATGELRFTASLSRSVCIVGAFRPSPRRIKVQRLVVGQRQSTGSPSAFVTSSFTAPSDCLLVVAASVERQGSGHFGLGISDSTGLTWTNRVSAAADDGDWFLEVGMWTAAVANGTAMTVTLSETPTNDALHVHVFAVTGHDRVNPTGATASVDATADDTGAMTLSAAPGAGSIVLAARCLGVTTGSSSATPGVGWWELADENIGNWHKLAVQARYGSISTAVAWTDVDDADAPDGGFCAVAMEINHAPSLLYSALAMQSFVTR